LKVKIFYEITPHEELLISIIDITFCASAQTGVAINKANISKTLRIKARYTHPFFAADFHMALI
jgi:hypothetical protein